jgi:hypothetical protein
VNHYLYAIVDRMPAAWRAPTSGLGNASVVPRRVEDVVVLGSLLETVPPPTPRMLTIHHEIVSTVIEAAALLPLRYGATVPAAALADWVAGHRTAVSAALDAVRNCLEMRVKLLRLDTVKSVGCRDRRGADGAPAGSPADPDLKALADRLVERAALSRWRYRAAGTDGNVAPSVAFLVPRGEMTGFLARIAPVASHATGIAVVPTGPWPPYSFVPDLERTARARVSPERLAADRRAG